MEVARPHCHENQFIGEQSFTSPTHECSSCNLAMTGQAVLELFKNNGHLYLSHIMRKPVFCICKNKDADQLHGNQKTYFVEVLCAFLSYKGR